MKRVVWLQGVVIVLLVLVLVLHIVGTRRNHEARVGELLEQIEEMEAQREESGAGGLETEMPVSVPQDSEWTFPILPDDYLMLTSPYGYRVSPILGVEMYHQGIDVSASWRAQVVASADGVVVEHWPPPDGYYRGHDVYGGLLILEHENGWQTVYAHLSATRVNTGDRVSAGDVIGRVGGTGKSRGEHLHFEMRDSDGGSVNPLVYVSP